MWYKFPRSARSCPLPSEGRVTRGVSRYTLHDGKRRTKREDQEKKTTKDVIRIAVMTTRSLPSLQARHVSSETSVDSRYEYEIAPSSHLISSHLISSAPIHSDSFLAYLFLCPHFKYIYICSEFDLEPSTKVLRERQGEKREKKRRGKMDHAAEANRTDLMTITRFVLNEQSKYPESRGDFTILLSNIVLGCKFVCTAVNKVSLFPYSSFSFFISFGKWHFFLSIRMSRALRPLDYVFSHDCV